jgi:hypothetical protein
VGHKYKIILATNNGKVSPRIFTFVVNYKFIDKAQWKIDERVMLDSFGPFEKEIDFTKGQYDYKVYLYPKGLNSLGIYQHLNSEFN